MKVNYVFYLYKRRINVNEQNKLVTQKFKLDNFKERGLNRIDLECEGHGTALIQVNKGLVLIAYAIQLITCFNLFKFTACGKV
jgi:hypothetical protein